MQGNPQTYLNLKTKEQYYLNFFCIFFLKSQALAG